MKFVGKNVILDLDLIERFCILDWVGERWIIIPDMCKIECLTKESYVYHHVRRLGLLENFYFRFELD